MVTIKRFDDVLAPTKEVLLKVYERVKNIQGDKEDLLKIITGFDFYNISRFDLQSLVDEPEQIENNFRDYLDGFSDNVKDVLDKFDFYQEITKLAANNVLYNLIKEFDKPEAFLGADGVSLFDIGYMFEDMLRKFSDPKGKEIGAFFTPPDVVDLMCNMLTAGHEEEIRNNQSIKIYDPTMGNAQMLFALEDHIKSINENINVEVYGQENDPFIYAMAKAEGLLRGKRVGDSHA